MADIAVAYANMTGGYPDDNTSFPVPLDPDTVYFLQLIDKIFMGLKLSLVLPICVCNVLIFAAVLKFSQLHTPTNVLVLSLALADLLVGALGIPMFCLVHHAHFGWELQRNVCLTSYVFLQGPSAVSMVTLLVISVERYVCIHHAFYYMRNCNMKRALVSVLLIWLYVWLIMPGLLFATNKWHSDMTDCNFGGVASKIYIGSCALHMLIIFVVTTVLHTLIARTARRFQVNMRLQRQRSTNSADNDHTLDLERQKKIAKMLAMILGIYYLCWVPYLISTPIALFVVKGENDPVWLHVMEQTAGLINMLNSFLNFFVYAGMNTEFRLAFYRLLGCERAAKTMARRRSSSMRTRSMSLSTGGMSGSGSGSGGQGSFRTQNSVC